MAEKKQPSVSTQNNEPQITAVSKDMSINRLLLDTGWKTATALLIPSFVGIYADTTFDTNPLYSAIGIAIGLMMVTAVVYRIQKSLDKRFNK